MKMMIQNFIAARIVCMVLLLPFSFINTAQAQFAPQAGLAGSTAIHKDSSSIVAWATQCSIVRGWMDIADTTLGKAITGDSSMALGMADANVVSLGDGGSAILHFANPIMNGPGADFAIFENGFRNPADSNEAFLELARVEVSNNGINWFPFYAQCHVDTLMQVAGAGTYLDARKIHNLAGKYVSGFGTPFDLDELSAIPSLNVNDIRYIRITDVVGTIAQNFCTRDGDQHCINDPYPTPFPTGGFDLDAVGVLHQQTPSSVCTSVESKIYFFPNPADEFIYFNDPPQNARFSLLSYEGREMMSGTLQRIMSLKDLSTGLYWLKISTTNHVTHTQALIRK